MAIQDVWLRNLKKLVEQEGNGRAGLRTVATLSGLSEEYIYQLVEGKPKKNGEPREVGKVAARKIAAAFADGRRPDWFDQEWGTDAHAGASLPKGIVANSTTPAANGSFYSRQALKLAQLFDLVPENIKNKVFAAASHLLHAGMDGEVMTPIHVHLSSAIPASTSGQSLAAPVADKTPSPQAADLDAQ